MALVVAYKAMDQLMANSIRDLLIQNGIPAMIRISAPTNILGFSLSYEPSFGEVLVEQEDAEKAEELIDGFLGTLGLLADAAPEDPPAG